MTDPAAKVRRAVLASMAFTEKNHPGFTHDDYDAAHAELDDLVAELAATKKERDDWKKVADNKQILWEVEGDRADAAEHELAALKEARAEIEQFADLRTMRADVAEARARADDAERELRSWLAWSNGQYPDNSPGDVIAAELDGTIILDDSVTTWNPLRSGEFFNAKLEAAEARLAALEPDRIEREARSLAGAIHVHGAIPARFWKDALKAALQEEKP